MSVPPKISIIYSSGMGKTKLIAEAIAEGATSIPGVNILIKDVSLAGPGDLKDADAILIGGSANNPYHKYIDSLLDKMEELDLKDRVGVAFGSMGCGAEDISPISQKMQSIGLDLIEPGEELRKAPKEKAMREYFMLGRHVAKGIKG
jgi:flavodoxin I